MNYQPDPKRPLAMANPFFPPDEQVWIQKEVLSVLNGKLSNGPRTEEFEKSFAKFCGTRHGVAFPSCTAALESCLVALNIKNGDEVLVPAQTFVATGMAVHLTGGVPVFTEISEQTFSMDFEDALQRMTPNTKGAIVVHFGGVIDPRFPDFVAEMHRLGKFVIEDAAHAHGAELNGVKAGNLADVGCFSFYPTKIMTTGEGGLLVTNRDDVAKMSRSLQNRGVDMDAGFEQYAFAGRNNRFPEISALLGISQLRSLSGFLEARRQIAETYTRALQNQDVFKPLIPENKSLPSYWRYTLLAQKDINREKLKSALAKDGINMDWAYFPALHLQPFFKKIYCTKEGQLPRTESLLKRHVCLPIHATLLPEDAEYVVARLLQHVDGTR